MEDAVTVLKMAVAMIVLVCATALGIFVMTISKQPVDAMVDNAHVVLNSAVDSDASSAANYNKPIPVATVWRIATRMAGNTTGNKNGNIKSISIKERSTSNPNEWNLLSVKLKDLDKYMDRKAYMSWSTDISGLYTLEVLLV